MSKQADVRPIYFVKHPDGSYSEAEPQPNFDYEIDAERYRWIRSHAGYNLNNNEQIGNFEVSQKVSNGVAWRYYEDALDNAIDKSMLAAPSCTDKGNDQ